MDNLGDLFLSSFWQGAGMAWSAFWGTMFANPWLLALLVSMVAGALILKLAPAKRRRIRR